MWAWWREEDINRPFPMCAERNKLTQNSFSAFGEDEVDWDKRDRGGVRGKFEKVPE